VLQRQRERAVGTEDAGYHDVGAADTHAVLQGGDASWLENQVGVQHEDSGRLADM
jgi:hypothetical protein